MSTRTPRYQPTQFAASGCESGTPERKARFVNALLQFIAADCPHERFTRSLYEALFTHGYFGFIAHYDRGGFYEAQLSTPERRARFLRDLRQDCEREANRDRPDLWSDVKRVLAEHLQPQESPTQARRLPTPPPRRAVSKKPAGPTLF